MSRTPPGDITALPQTPQLEAGCLLPKNPTPAVSPLTTDGKKSKNCWKCKCWCCRLHLVVSRRSLLKGAFNFPSQSILQCTISRRAPTLTRNRSLGPLIGWIRPCQLLQMDPRDDMPLAHIVLYTKWTLSVINCTDTSSSVERRP